MSALMHIKSAEFSTLEKVLGHLSSGDEQR